MRSVILGCVSLLLPGLVAAQTVRTGLVAQGDGAPVVLETTASVAGRLHARVRIRNVSDRPLASVTVAITIGEPLDGAVVSRRTDTVPIALASDAVANLDLEGMTPEAVRALGPTAPALDAELAVLAVTWASGETWHAPGSAAWLGRADRPGTIRCLDRTGGTHAVGDVALVGAALLHCDADGRLTAATQEPQP